jgi:hypothetical protein
VLRDQLAHLVETFAYRQVRGESRTRPGATRLDHGARARGELFERKPGFTATLYIVHLREQAAQARAVLDQAMRYLVSGVSHGNRPAAEVAAAAGILWRSYRQRLA